VIAFQDHHAGEIEDGMVLSVEAYVGVEGEDEGLKLEEQVLVTSEGVEVLGHAPTTSTSRAPDASDGLRRRLDRRVPQWYHIT
jgi:Xaa-Pro aminopeptidase